METTYSLKSLIQKYYIEIPKLQRDYAFGRKNATEKRENLLEKLQKYYVAKKKLKLDIIYGTTTQDDKLNKLILLDGQQRVTTLFLLHWYTAVVGDKFLEFKKLFYDTENERPFFCYNTRESSEDFCRIMATLCYKNHKDEPVDLLNDSRFIEAIHDPGRTISEVFKNEKWFLCKWNNDPTIAGMLNMLDSIKKKFPANVCGEYYESLVSDDSAITFEFKNLEGFTKPDELYIKMNARGVELTRYENLKDFILEDLKECPEKRELISKKMDNTWLKFFWSKRSKKENSDQYYPDVDLMMTNYITLLAIYNYILQYKSDTDGGNQLNDEVKRLIDAKDKDAGYVIPYTTYSETSSEKKGDKTVKHIGYKELINKEFITNIMEPAFDVLTDECTSNQYLKDFQIHGKEDIADSIIDVLCNDFKAGEQLEKKLKAWAFIKYLYTCKFSSTLPQEKELESWMRFVCNVGAATNVGNDIKFFAPSIQAFDKIFEYKNGKTDPAKYIPDDWEEKEKDIKALRKDQIREEIFKMKLSNADSNWAEALKIAEGVGKKDKKSKLPYFEGTLRYVFRLIGLEKCFAHDKISIDSFDKTSKLEDFNAYVDALHKIFPDATGCKCEPSLIRALLVQGDYTLQHNRNISLLQNTGRDISWRRFLEQDEHSDKLKIFTKIVEYVKDYNGMENDIEGILKDFIKERTGDPAPLWCKCLCDILEKDSELLSRSRAGEITMSADRNIRHSDEKYYILSGERMSGKHVELYTYWIYTVFFRGKPEFEYIPKSTDSEEPGIKYKEKYMMYYLKPAGSDTCCFEFKDINDPARTCTIISKR